MKGNDLLLIGGIGLLAYMMLGGKKESTIPTINIALPGSPAAAATGIPDIGSIFSGMASMFSSLLGAIPTGTGQAAGYSAGDLASILGQVTEGAKETIINVVPESGSGLSAADVARIVKDTITDVGGYGGGASEGDGLSAQDIIDIVKGAIGGVTDNTGSGVTAPSVVDLLGGTNKTIGAFEGTFKEATSQWNEYWNNFTKGLQVLNLPLSETSRIRAGEGIINAEGDYQPIVMLSEYSLELLETPSFMDKMRAQFPGFGY